MKKLRCTISYNAEEEMMSIENHKGKCVFYGNYWDFDKNPAGLKSFMEDLGIEVTMDATLPES